MDVSSASSNCDIVEQTTGVRRRRASMSSTDSEPFRKCSRVAGSQTCDSERGEDADSLASESGEILSVCHSSAGAATMAEVLDTCDGLQVLCDGDGGPLTDIPIERVSKTAVASVAARVAQGSLADATACIMVADSAPGAFVVDTGTRLCLPNGKVVGVVAAVMGPVTSCAYAVLCHEEVFAQLSAVGCLATGNALHYDLTMHNMIHNASVQCDTRRGTDASYVNDEELPPYARPDFSDDEAEQQWKAERRQRKRESAVAQSVTAYGEEESVSDDSLTSPIEVDWEKVDSLEGYVRDMGPSEDVFRNSDNHGSGVHADSVHTQNGNNNEVATVEQEPPEVTPPPVVDGGITKVVVPPWLTQ
ncbi:hypothetical protein TRVL_07404 [Trypanosoma vivax]|nr:hypothetical protein TRVL_07404 [Trypanosoma vivax]